MDLIPKLPFDFYCCDIIPVILALKLVVLYSRFMSLLHILCPLILN